MNVRPQSHFAAVADPLAWCEESARCGAHLYLLVDQTAQTANQNEWLHLKAGSAVNLFAQRTADPRALRIAPLLTALQGAARQAAAARAFARQSAEQPLASLIASPLPMSELQARLTRRFDLDAAGSDMLLRLWDPRVMLALAQAMLEPLTRIALAFGTQALLPDRAGGSVAVPLDCPEADPLRGAARFACSQTELDALTERSAPDSVLAMLREQQPDLLEQIPDDRRHALAAEQLQECISRGLDAPRDHALALGLAIEHGTGWWQRVEWAPCIQRGVQQRSLLDAYRGMRT